MTKKHSNVDVHLDKEEQELSDTLDSVFDIQSLRSKSLNEDLSMAHDAAAQYFKKDARVNIRISSQDLMSLKQQAAYKGLPYQTFIASVLHEYAAGHFGR